MKIWSDIVISVNNFIHWLSIIIIFYSHLNTLSLLPVLSVVLLLLFWQQDYLLCKNINEQFFTNVLAP